MSYLCFMEFYGRDKQLAALRKIAERSHTTAQMTVISGRRRVGKTRLIKESLSGEKFLYFFVSRKEESMLCRDWHAQIEQTLDVVVPGDFSRFQQLFVWLCGYAENHHLNLVIDEFQDFYHVNPSVYSDMQNAWDTAKEEMRMNLILSGSVQSLMRKIFENYREPLFGRATGKLFIKPFGVKTLRTLMREKAPDHSADDLLTLYIVTGGVPKYVEFYTDRNLLTHQDMIEAFFTEDSFHLEEGKALLLEEFGKDYGTYFSILVLMAHGKTDRGAITSIIQRDVGGYLRRLEEDYSIIKAYRPLFSKPQSRNVKYFIDDNFLNFWFRFIFKNKGIIELENFALLREKINREFPEYRGRYLEKFIRKDLAESMDFSEVGNYWQRGNKNEIDVIAYNELTRKATIGEVKVNPENISLDLLRLKAQEITKELGGYEITYRGYSLEDVLGVLGC